MRRGSGRTVVAIVAALAALGSAGLSGCGSSGGSSGSSAPSPSTTAPGAGRTGPSAPRSVIDALFPPAPDPAHADQVADECMGGSGHDMSSMDGSSMDGSSMDMGISTTRPEDAAFTERRSGGAYERVYEGSNPRVEVSKVPFDTAPTAAQRAAAGRFVDEVRRSVDRHGWTDLAQAVRDGYRPMQRCSLHYIDVAATLDGRVMDPDAPEYLVAEADAHGHLSVRSVMFLADGPTAHGPQPFGTLAIWHYHRGDGCQVGGLYGVPLTGSACPAGTRAVGRSPEMLHVSLAGQAFTQEM